MKAGYGGTVQGCTLVEGQAAVTAGTFIGVNVVECVADGDILVTWNSGNTQTISYTAGWVNPIDCKKVQVVSGTWNVAKV